MQFEFSTTHRIVFGPGSISSVAKMAANLGNRGLIVTGKMQERASRLLNDLGKAGISTFIFSISGEPTTAKVIEGLQLARQAGCNFVIGLGGGSVLDTGKAIAALLANEGDLVDYLEVIGKGKALSKPSVPFIAIPTTAGTGSEVTRNAVLTSTEHQVKVSLRSHFMFPAIAVVDPELTISMPPGVTAATGLDALTQLIEPYVCNIPNPLTDSLCREGIRRVSGSLFRAYKNGSDLSAREDMALASLSGGMALANARLGAVHGLAGPLGGRCSAPHGAICACLLPHVMKANLQALKERCPQSPVIGRYDEVARLLTGKTTATGLDGTAWVYDLCRDLSISPLSRFGLAEDMIPEIVNQARDASSMKGNPITLTAEELSGILKQAM